jgi:predicted metal-dependent enzyme (double-stranded beta helix superfamily)
MRTVRRGMAGEFSIDVFVGDCLDAVRREGVSGGPAVRQILQRTVSKPSAIIAAIGEPSAAPVFSTWHTSEELTVLHVVWPPTVDLMPHDHMMWASIGLYGGREDNRFFRALPGGRLENRGGTTLLGGDTVLLGPDTIHAVANPSSAWTGAIHVYGGDYFRPGRRLWLDDGGPIEFDAARVMAVLDDAAARAGRTPVDQ